MAEVYVKLPDQEKSNFINHAKTNLVDVETKDGAITGSIRLIKSVNSTVIAELRLNVDGSQEVYNLYSDGIGMLFDQPQGIGLEILEDSIKLTLPDELYNNILGVQ